MICEWFEMVSDPRDCDWFKQALGVYRTLAAQQQDPGKGDDHWVLPAAPLLEEEVQREPQLQHCNSLV